MMKREKLLADFLFKVTVIGDPAVGKSSLIRRYVENYFVGDYIMTMGTHISSKNIVFSEFNKRINTKLVIWDLGGQPHFKEVRRAYYLGARGSILVFDLTRPDTFMELHNWANELLNHAGKIPTVLVGNKSDLRYLRSVPEIDGYHFANRMNTSYFETSAKTGENVERVFEVLVKKIFLHNIPKEEKTKISEETIV